MDTTGGASGAMQVDLDRLIQLFTGPNSADLYERHTAAINKLCRNNAGGFAIRDLPKVQQVLELSLALLKRGTTDFVAPLCELVSTLGKPFIRRTATDEFKMLNHITNVLAAVGDIFRTPGLPAQLVAVAALAITAFANAYGNRPNALDLASQQHTELEGTQRQYHTNQSLLNKSGIVGDLIAALARAILIGNAAAAAPPPPPGTPDPSTVAAALAAPLAGALLALSYNGDNAAAMVDGGVLQCVAALLGRGPHAETTCTAVELLWNVVEHAPDARAHLSRPLPPLQALARSGAAGRPGTQRSENGEAHGAEAALGAAAEGSDAGGFDGNATSTSRGGTAALGASGIILSLDGDAQYDDDAAPSPASARGDGSWHQLEDGDLAGGGRGYEGSLSQRTNGAGDTSFDEFGDAPDLRAPSAPPSTAGVGGGGGGGGGGEVEEEEPEPAPAPVVQSLADALSALLKSLLLSGFSKADKELRNDVMVVANLLLEAADFRAAAAYAGLFEPLLAAATCPELGSHPELVQHYALSVEPLDHELRLLVWGALVHGCLLPEVLDAAVGGGFVRVLLLYVNPGEGHPAVRRWNPDQLATLRSAALSQLHTLSPLCPEEYERAGGPATLLAFVGGTPGPMHLEAALRHLHRLFGLVPETRDALGGAGLIPVLLSVVQDSVGSGTGGGTLGHVGGSGLMGGGPGQPEPVRHFALLCLTALCTVHAENQRRLRKAQGVGVLLNALTKLRGLDPLLPAPYAVAVLECIWAAVVPDRKSTARFLVEQGMDYLLNHLEGGNKAHRPVVLRVLSDLLENARSHPFFHEWQSDTNKQTAAHLLLSIWMEEDAQRGMSGPDGMLANTSRPLAGIGNRTKWLPSENVAYGNISPAKKETLAIMMDSLSSEVVLAKIYGCFKLLGFDACPYLDARDHAVLAAVEKYAKFRQGEVWRSIQSDFEASGVRPTAPDRARLSSGIELSESLATAVREAQARLLGRAQAGLKAAETKLYDGMRTQAKLEAEYRYIQLQEKTPLTVAEMRRHKEQKAEMLRNSLQTYEYQHTEDD